MKWVIVIARRTKTRILYVTIGYTNMVVVADSTSGSSL